MKLESQRKAYGQALVHYGETDDRIVVMEADLGKSTMSIIFEERFPERYLEVGIAEANMISIAAGLSLCGKVPFVNSFAVFVTGRAFDQIRQGVCIAGLHVIMAGSSAGFSDFGDGSTHQSVEDIAIMRSLPNMTVLCPADALEAEKMVKAAIDHNGPIYIRICKSDMPVVLDEKDPYTFGKMIELEKEGEYAIFATGWMTHVAQNAADILKAEGIPTRVIHVGCIKPIDMETLMRVVRQVKGIVTAEEHSVIGGLGSAICDAMAGYDAIPVEKIGVQDSFGCSGHSHEELLQHYGLTKEAIVAAVKKLTKK